jgi:uncharacterized protein YijF (DUF1287 family)
MRRRIPLAALVFAAICGVIAYATWKPLVRCARMASIIGSPSDGIVLIPKPKTAAEKIVNGAKREVIRGVTYDATYVAIAYPNGDVRRDRGACTDVVIRALRDAGYDLQKLVHEDMESNFGLYPSKWGLTKPDSNIDHRRVPNLMVFLRRFGKELPLDTSGRNVGSWRPGDIVCWNLNGNGLTHIGVISNDLNSDSLPLVIHNMGRTWQEDCLRNWKIIGHFRYPI